MADRFLIAHCGHTNRAYEHICWWNPDSRGYTICTTKAGRYTEDEARRICTASECIAVPERVAVDLSRTTPYYRMSNGTLGGLYDGGPHHPVENSRKSWTEIKSAAVVIGIYAKPTPMTPSKMRAIYLEAPSPAPTGEQHG
ncbi:hypothetical protein [Variovorax paradoxus]|uniref:hypothetical protein n=1 Tax=Variovorax paradoxus TaxID=34073 RepID=UPI0019314848|nr:hypothetical protein INQ48_20665 [Variovorax paradoxus]